MIKITFEINGQPVIPGNLADALEAAMLGALENKVRAKLAGIRDPDTGEFPVVAVRGSSLENLSFDVSGSPKLVSLVQEALRRPDQEGDNEMIGEASTAGASGRALGAHRREDAEIGR